MDASDLIISVLALNPCYALNIEKSEINCNDFLSNMLKEYPCPALKNARIRKHWIHRDSMQLNNAFNELIHRRVIKLWAPENFFTWDFPQTPFEYFKEKIKPSLSMYELRDLEKYALSVQ